MSGQASPVPDALRTQLAEVLAAHQATTGMRVSMGWTCACGHWVKSGKPSEIVAHQSDALLPLLARARVEGAAEALREAAESVTELAEELGDAEDEAENAEVSWALGVARLRAEVKAEYMQDHAAALSASTTTEGDPT